MARLVEVLTEDVISAWWAKLPHTDGFWGAFAGTDRAGFQEILLACPFVIQLPFGLLRVSSYRAGGDVNIHGVFWDRKALHDADAYERAAKYIFGLTGARRAIVEVPAKSRVLHRLLESLQFHAVATIAGGLKTPAGCFDMTRYVRIRQEGGRHGRKD